MNVKFSPGKIIKSAIHPFVARAKQIDPSNIGQTQEYPAGYKRRMVNTDNQLARGKNR